MGILPLSMDTLIHGWIFFVISQKLIESLLYPRRIEIKLIETSRGIWDTLPPEMLLSGHCHMIRKRYPGPQGRVLGRSGGCIQHLNFSR